MTSLRSKLRAWYHRVRKWRSDRAYHREMVRRARLTDALIVRGGTDTERWANDRSFENYWVQRNQMLAKHVEPGASVLEFGAGMRELEKLLPANCRYTPSDLVSRGPDTFVCDLNTRPLPVLDQHDVIVMSGVLEYLHEPEIILNHLNMAAPLLLLSYAPWNGDEATISARRGNGFVNDLKREGVESLLRCAGWQVEQIGCWHQQVLLRCSRGRGR